MKFLVDAHLPRRLVHLLRDSGHDAIHTGDLPLQNRTPDELINQVSLAEERLVITKDADFVNTHLIHRKPYKLLLISTGNIRNSDLLRLFEQNLVLLVDAFEHHTYVELGHQLLTLHQ
jgi:predicted nuclease of predicted toxin-antitoxin system